METAFLIGRLIVGLYYLFNAGNHFFQVKALSGYAQSKGIPAPNIAVLGSGVLLLIGGLSLLTGFQPTLGVAALVIFFIPVTFTMHAFWKIQDPMMRTMEMVNFMKNLALMGSSLMFLAIPQPWPYSLF
ncbi:DoxX family protein [Thermanaerothrix daxensis]|uniref:DoxX family protein n=1 Tax=Thermanaerothrix daxensis TaxID=869279 RepID=A0A0P6Y5C4_9CHLR|nr:DoxX family membrane protein [Thermanaerothrix daxensis]KPL84627.1 DoxX family protein [Thermanaerothrix daxensis]